MNAARVAGPGPVAVVPPHDAKLQRVAREFEAILLNSLLGSLQHTFSSLLSKPTESGSGNYDYLGTQALASSLAAKGGLGIADMIVRNLQQKGIAGAGNDNQKSLAGGAPLERLF